jgi:hypothetical protein
VQPNSAAPFFIIPLSFVFDRPLAGAAREAALLLLFATGQKEHRKEPLLNRMAHSILQS